MTGGAVTPASTPVRAVRTAIESGAGTLAGISRATGLAPDVVATVVEHLTRAGALHATTLSLGCPDTGCGSCASGSETGRPGCGSAAPGPRRRGAALVALSLRPRLPDPPG